MAWIEITKRHVLQRATLAEIVANNTAGIPPKNPLSGSSSDAEKYDALFEVIKSTTVEIRGAIAEGGKCTLDSNKKTIPPSLLNTALALIVFRYASRVLSQDIVVQDARYQEYSRALDALDELRKGTRTVEDPDSDEFADNNSSQIATSQEDRFTRHKFRLF